MGYDLEKLYVGPRSEKRAKRRRINRVLNILIGIVFILIIFFGWKFLLSNDNKQSTAEVVESTETNNSPSSEGGGEDPAVAEGESDSTNEEESAVEEEDPAEVPESESTEHEEITDGDPDSNIIRSIENKAWAPIGTSQSEPHTIVYDSGSVDRTEMERAISYAVGYDAASLTVWELSRQADNQVAATISTKDNSHVYRVYIEWVPAEGWKPLRIDELRENDSKYYKGNSASETVETEEAEG
ncbi:YrrS family protein [Bacillus sp. PS06]|uniref:YrrS family protein n=1 Tax=Bacillus sp. PS06 TaxID=2764176 RepID=UPI001784591D|nr:YrrS family protein [Bacillus sp. PS06]MBD8069242.1 DUF1510 family protein [Bacillus sp. PS06]